jgi:hypothetical protein
MKMSSSLPISSAYTIGLTLAIAFILLASNFTIVIAQQQQLTSQPGEIENGTTTALRAPTTTFQSTNDSFSVQVPEGWIIHDVNNTGSMLSEESTQGYGILAQLCPEEQQGAVLANTSASTNRSGSSNTSSCQGAQNIVHIIRYPDLDTRLQADTNVTTTTTNNTTTTGDNVLSYQLQKLQEVGYRGIQILNSSDRTVNLTSAQTNETIATVPAKLVEMTYSTNFAPNETRTGYFLSTATKATLPNLGTTKGYGVFYEGNSTAAAAVVREITATSDNLSSLPLAVAQIFDSFELIVAPEVAQLAAAAAAGQTGGTAEDGDNSCHPSYPDVCIPPPPPNLNCDDVSASNFEVVGSDPHGFDGDNDGIGCEDGGGGGDDDGGEGEGEGGEGEGEGGEGEGEGGEGEGEGGEGEGEGGQPA